MKGSHRDWRIIGISILFAAVPFLFAAVRAIRTGRDFRYLWVALASFSGSSVVMVVGRANSRGLNGAATLAAGVLVMATSLAVLAAWLLGTHIGTGSLVVACAFGCCFAASCALYILAHH